jgi:tetratricopeptide (TPR) repeat protein
MLPGSGTFDGHAGVVKMRRMEEKQIPLRSLDVTVELEIARLPEMVSDETDQAFHPRVCVCVDHSSGMILHFALSKKDGSEIALVIDTLNGMAKRLQGIPRQILSRRPRLVASLKNELQRAGTDISLRESLPQAEKAIQNLCERFMIGVKKEPSIIHTEGMTLDHMIAFADAAKLFYQARPWQRLWDDDLIQIHTPSGPKGTAFTQVLGAAGQVMGLGFSPTRQAHEDIQSGQAFPQGVGVWTLMFGVLDQLPFDDGEVWENQNLPLVDEDSYPRFSRYTKSGGLKPPKPSDLVWAEGLLRAIAASTQEEFESGRWEKQVETFSGPARYHFSMPVLLEQLDPKQVKSSAFRAEPPHVMMERMLRGMQQQVAVLGRTPSENDLQEITARINSDQKSPVFVPASPAEQAQELCFQARSARGLRIGQLAREALQIDPNCCDALELLAERLSADQSKIPLLEQAVQAGERQVGPDFFDQNTGHFWGRTESRPYMRARAALAYELLNEEREDEGIAHLQALLILNPGDNQGNRYLLAESLLSADRLDELDQLLNAPDYKDEFSPQWQYTLALLEYRKNGDAPASRKQLADAARCNPLVGLILAGAEPDDTPVPSSMSRSDIHEAVSVASTISSGWQQTEGALDWLKSHTLRQSKKAATWERERRRKAGKKKR